MTKLVFQLVSVFSDSIIAASNFSIVPSIHRVETEKDRNCRGRHDILFYGINASEFVDEKLKRDPAVYFSDSEFTQSERKQSKICQRLECGRL